MTPSTRHPAARLLATFAGLGLIALAGCGTSPDDVGDDGAPFRTGANQIVISDVGYGGTAVDKDGAGFILPELFVIENRGEHAVSLDGWYLTDGADWTGDGLVRFPEGTRIAAGDVIVVASYPPVSNYEATNGFDRVSYEKAYGVRPDFEIGGWDESIPQLQPVKGRIRLSRRPCIDERCAPVEERVWLLDGAGTDPQEAVYLLEQDWIDEIVTATYPPVSDKGVSR